MTVWIVTYDDGTPFDIYETEEKACKAAANHIRDNYPLILSHEPTDKDYVILHNSDVGIMSERFVLVEERRVL